MHHVLSVILAVLCIIPSTLLYGDDENQDKRPYVIILYGAPGSGRASMAVRIRRDFAFPTISPATLLASHVIEGTPLGIKGRNYCMNGGDLPQELLPEILCDRLMQSDCSHGALLEDITLAVPQVLDLQRQLSSRFQFLIINIDASDEWVIQRVEHRFVCYTCGYVYDDSGGNKKRKIYCDACCSPLQRRQNDMPEVVRARLCAYRMQKSQLLELYKDQGVLVQIAGNRQFDNIYNELICIIEAKTGLTAAKENPKNEFLAQD